MPAAAAAAKKEPVTANDCLECEGVSAAVVAATTVPVAVKGFSDFQGVPKAALAASGTADGCQQLP